MRYGCHKYRYKWTWIGPGLCVRSIGWWCDSCLQHLSHIVLSYTVTLYSFASCFCNNVTTLLWLPALMAWYYDIVYVAMIIYTINYTIATCRMEISRVTWQVTVLHTICHTYLHTSFTTQNARLWFYIRSKRPFQDNTEINQSRNTDKEKKWSHWIG